MHTKQNELSMPPKIHLKKLYEFRKHVKASYIGEDMEFLLAKTDNKIREVESKLNNG